MTYKDIYITGMLVIAFLATLTIKKSNKREQVIDVPPYWMSFILVVFAVYCMAELPVYMGSWNDRHGYVYNFIQASKSHNWSYEGNELFFHQWIWLISRFANWNVWLYLTAIVYVGNYLIAAFRLAREYSSVLFLMMLCCFQYYSYGTNTIRAGFAASFIILALSFCNDKIIMTFFLILGLLSHNSMIIPIAALILAWNVRKTNLYILGWFICIIISLVIGQSLQEQFSFLIADSRVSYLGGADWQGYKVGFRWDFLLYSSLPILIGYYYIFRLNFKSEFYEFVYRMYLAANGFWILVIRANFSDRFAYLSWFLYPVLLVYPLLNKQLYQNSEFQARNVNLVLWGEFGFCLLMFVRDGGSLFGFKLF